MYLYIKKKNPSIFRTVFLLWQVSCFFFLPGCCQSVPRIHGKRARRGPFLFRGSFSQLDIQQGAQPNCKPKCPRAFTWQTQSAGTHNDLWTHTSADTMHYKAHIVFTYCTLIWTKHSLAHVHKKTQPHSLLFCWH